MDDTRVDQFAELLSEGVAYNQIRQRMGLTQGETASTYRRIKRELGEQAR